MRYTGKGEREKRGCLDCLDRRIGRRGIMCPYDRCPYRELDKYDNYNDFIRETDCIVGLLLRDPEDKGNAKRRKSRCKRVMVVETGQIFNTLADAAEAFGVPDDMIWQAVIHPTRKCCGYHWRECAR